MEHDDPVVAISKLANDFDLVLLGATRSGRHEKVIGGFATRVAALTDRPLLVMSSRSL